MQNMESLQNEMLDKVTKVFSPFILEWINIVNQLGLNNEDYNGWVKTFLQNVEEFGTDIVNDVNQSKSDLLDSIDQLMEKNTKLYKDLGMPIPEYGEQNLGLFTEEMILRKKCADLENVKQKRELEIETLKARLSEVCQHLGKDPFFISESPLPSEAEMETYIKRVEKMEVERNSRQEDFRTIRLELLDLMDELKTSPTLDFERMVLYGDVDSFAVTDSNMKLLRNFRESLLQQMENVRSEISDLREKIFQLCNLLFKDHEGCNKILESFKGHSYDTLESLKREFKHYDELKKANIKEFVLKLRGELENVWDKCKFSLEQRLFEPMHDTLYTEDLMNLYENEIQKLTIYHTENKNIYDLLDERERLWNKLMELDERQNAPNRYKNRGGQLLKEEKERNLVFKKIPKIEEKILGLTATYELKNKKPFLYWGQTMEELINKNIENYEEEKKLKLSARKMVREVKPKGSATALFPTVSTLALSRARLNNNATPNSVRKTPVKYKCITPNLHSSIHSDRSRNGIKSVPTKMISSKVRPVLRYSTEKKKRLRQISKTMNQTRKIETSSEYACFENEISNKESCRSTVFVQPTIVISTPGKSRVGTPKRLKGTPQSKVKLTAAKLNMDL